MHEHRIIRGRCMVDQKTRNNQTKHYIIKACQLIRHHIRIRFTATPSGCVVSPAPAQPKAPAALEADPPSGWHHTEGGSPSPPPGSPPPAPAVPGAAWEAAEREGRLVTWARSALPSPTGRTARGARGSCCRWARSFCSDWRAESGTCCRWTTRRRPGLWRAVATG